MDSDPKYLLLVTGVPASGKTYLAHVLANKFSGMSINHKILSTDNLQAFLAHQKEFDQKNIQNLFYSHKWDLQLRQFQLNKQSFNEKAWNISRKVAGNHNILDIIFLNCEILIVEDELPLKSQRKVFRKYACEKNIKFLEIQLQINLEDAIQNNIKRGQQNDKQKVSNQVIQTSFEKYESNPDALILTKNTISDFLNQKNILENFKTVQIHDNYAFYLSKKSMVHQYAQKQINQNELRKLITKIIKDEAVALEYFLGGLQSKEKAQILAECKKVYIQQKRKIPFKQVVEIMILKNKEKQKKQHQDQYSKQQKGK